MEKNQKNNSQDFDFSVVEDKIQQVQNIIEKAVKSKDFQEMSQSVTQMVNKTLDQYKKEHQEMGKTREKPQADHRSDRESGSAANGEKLQMLYMKPTGEKVRSILLAVFGGILTGSTACGFLAVQMVRLLTDSGSSGAAQLCWREWQQEPLCWEQVSLDWGSSGDSKNIRKLWKKEPTVILQSLRRQSESL